MDQKLIIDLVWPYIHCVCVGGGDLHVHMCVPEYECRGRRGGGVVPSVRD